MRPYSPSCSSERLAHIREHRAQAHGDAEEARGLAIDQVVVLGFGDQAAEGLGLQQLALDHLLGEADEQVEHLEVALLERDAEGLHVEPVAGEHAAGVAPGGVGGGPAAAGVGRVDDVVVDQGGGVDHLHYGAQPDAATAAIAKSARRQQQQGGPDALAAAFAQVAGDFGDGLDGRVGIARELPLHGAEVIPQQVEDFFRCRYRLCAHVAAGSPSSSVSGRQAASIWPPRQRNLRRNVSGQLRDAPA